MRTLDLEQFRARPNGQPPNVRQPARHKVGKWFVKGPIPGDWLTQAASVSFRALRVGLALWYLAGLNKQRSVKPTWATWRRFDLAPEAGRLGLAALERAGLVAVDRQPGCCPLVTLRGASEHKSNATD